MAIATWIGGRSQGEPSFLILLLAGPKGIAGHSRLYFQSIIEAELLDNLKVFEFELTGEEMKEIHGLNKNIR